MLEEAARPRANQFATGMTHSSASPLRVSTAWAPAMCSSASIGLYRWVLARPYGAAVSTSGQTPVLGLSFDAQTATAEAPKTPLCAKRSCRWM
jgi:hypothetical protein